jgi:hypothetical protein
MGGATAVNAKLVKLEVWAAQLLGDQSPNKDTLRRWCREAKIFPAPQKIGRAYYVSPDAQYVDDYNDSDFMRRVRESTAA